jgi:hypothetical protein
MNASRYDCCAGCRHFNGRPADIEAALPGLSSLSSAYAAVRSNDGICAVHDRYVAASSVCAAYMTVVPPTQLDGRALAGGYRDRGPQIASTCTRQS